MDSWLQNLDEDELKEFAPALYALDDIEDAALLMYREGILQPMGSTIDKDSYKLGAEQEREERPPKKYWDKVKAEIRILVCTDDEKYKELREKLSKAQEKGSSFIVTTIASCFAGLFGVEAGILTGFCALALQSIAKIGKEAYCQVEVQ